MENGNGGIMRQDREPQSASKCATNCSIDANCIIHLELCGRCRTPLGHEVGFITEVGANL